jgi:hypothetical protein
MRDKSTGADKLSELQARIKEHLSKFEDLRGFL